MHSQILEASSIVYAPLFCAKPKKETIKLSAVISSTTGISVKRISFSFGGTGAEVGTGTGTTSSVVFTLVLVLSTTGAVASARGALVFLVTLFTFGGCVN